MNILIFGATGLIGSNLANYFKSKKKYKILLFSFKKIDQQSYISNLFTKIFLNHSDNLSILKKYLSNNKILTKFIFLKGSRSSKLEEIIEVT